MTDDDLARLKAHRADVPLPTPDAWRSAHMALTEVIEQEAACSRVPGGIVKLALLRGRRRRVRWTVRIGLALAVAIAAIVVAATLRSGSPTAPPPAAAQVLRQLAAVAASQPVQANIALGSGQYLHTRSQSIDANVYGACTFMLRKEVERWIAADGSGLERRTQGDQPEFLSKDDRSRCAPVLAKGESLGMTSETRYGPGCMFAAPIDLSKLPTEPSRLRKLLETGKVEGGPPGPGEAFIQIGDLLRQTDASPRLRSALYEAATGLRGVQSLGERVDFAGRKGIGLAIVDRGSRNELIFDPRTSALLAERNTIARTSASKQHPVGAVTEDAVYWPSKVVDALPSFYATAKQGRPCTQEELSPMAPPKPPVEHRSRH